MQGSDNTAVGTGHEIVTTKDGEEIVGKYDVFVVEEMATNIKAIGVIVLSK